MTDAPTGPSAPGSVLTNLAHGPSVRSPDRHRKPRLQSICVFCQTSFGKKRTHWRQVPRGPGRCRTGRRFRARRGPERQGRAGARRDALGRPWGHRLPDGTGGQAPAQQATPPQEACFSSRSTACSRARGAEECGAHPPGPWAPSTGVPKAPASRQRSGTRTLRIGHQVRTERQLEM